MTNSEQPSRIDRIEQALEATLNLTQRNREDIAETNRTCQRNANAIATLSERMEQFIQQAEADREFMRLEFQAIRSEMQGIRTETQRIIRHLFGDNSV
jgi:uncharacterized protein YoxC